MVEASMLIRGHGIGELPGILRDCLPRARRSLDDPRIVIVEHPARWFGCSASTVLICADAGEACSRLTILRCGGRCLPIGLSERRRIRLLSDILSAVHEVCTARGWTRDDVGLLV